MSSLQSTPSALNSGSDLPPVTFAASGQYFASGGAKGVRVWRIEDGQPTAKIKVQHVQCVAFSKDGKWIAAGTFWGDVMVWDAKIHKQTFATWKVEDIIRGLDFSPDASRLVALGNRTATIWNLPTHELVARPLHRDNRVLAAKYSPRGDRIAAATEHSIRIYASNDVSRRLVDIPIQITTCHYNACLVWSDDHLFVLSIGEIKKIDASTGSVVSKWPVPDTDRFSGIVMPKHGEFIACSANRAVTFWDPSTHAQLGAFRHSQDIRSIALSPDGRFLAVAVDREKIAIERLSRIIEPEIEIGNAILDMWKRDELPGAEEALTKAISASQNPHHHVLASRALILAHQGHSKRAVADAQKSIQLQPSVIGYIAKSVALIANKEKRKAYRACDIAFRFTHVTHIGFLLLIKAVIVCMTGEHDDAICRVGDLIDTVHLDAECYVVQAYMHTLHGKSLMESGEYACAVQSFNDAQTKLRHYTSRALSVISLISGWKFDNLDITIRQCLCEALYAAGRIKEAGESLLKILNISEYARGPLAMWVVDFLQQYLSTPESESRSNAILEVPRDDNISIPHATLFLTEWVKLKLMRTSWRDALSVADDFRASSLTIYRIICEQLDTMNKATDASDCFLQMMRNLGEETNVPAKEMEWASQFKQGLLRKLEQFGDAALHGRQHDEAISKYTAALSLHETSPPAGLFVKRSRAYVLQAQAMKDEAREQAHSDSEALPQSDEALGNRIKSLFEQSLADANMAISLDPSSPWGYERKHATLHMEKQYDEAIVAFETMLSRISQSPDMKIRGRQTEYVNPAQTKAAIRKVIQDTIRDSPRVLINTFSGRLLDKTQQASWFESLPVYKELISSTTTCIDHSHFQQEVAQYYRYAAFSHTWEENEPLYGKVINIAVYDLGESPTHDKLLVFCKIAKGFGFHWAWSDTCCINKEDHIVLQEALVAMFKWYEGSAMTIVFLRDVHFPLQRGGLTRSHWNTRAWTFQEYHASKVVRFYTKNWEPYLNLDIANHKDSPEIISEMEGATGVSAQALMGLRPGLQDIREKLCIASPREATFVEDTAYSLLGIFSVALPVVYGEGDKALGRLLAHLLATSGDTSILAWTGKSGSFNSCLPANIGVFSQSPNLHIPAVIPSAESETVAIRARPSSPNLALAMRLHDHLNELPVPSFSGYRMRLPCLTFKLGPVSGTRDPDTSEYVFRAKTEALGIVKIRTEEDLSEFHSLILIHPWIDFLLDRPPVGNIIATTPENTNYQPFPTHELPPPPEPFNTARAVGSRPSIFSHIRSLSARADDRSTLLSPSSLSQGEKRERTLRFITRLRQPFGALLFTLMGKVCKRVAPESLIKVQVEELTSKVLNKLIEGADVLDML